MRKLRPGNGASANQRPHIDFPHKSTFNFTSPLTGEDTINEYEVWLGRRLDSVVNTEFSI